MLESKLPTGTSKTEYSFVLDIPVGGLLSSKAVFVPCDRKLQRAYSFPKWLHFFSCTSHNLVIPRDRPLGSSRHLFKRVTSPNSGKETSSFHNTDKIHWQISFPFFNWSTFKITISSLRGRLQHQLALSANNEIGRDTMLAHNNCINYAIKIPFIY